MSIFDRTTPEGLNDAYLEEHAIIKRDIFGRDVWGINYAGINYVSADYSDMQNTDFWDIYKFAISRVELELHDTHKKGAANIKVRKHVEMYHIRRLKQIFLDVLDHGEYLTYKGKRYYKEQEHLNLITPFAREISGIWPIYKYKLSI